MEVESVGGEVGVSVVCVGTDEVSDVLAGVLVPPVTVLIIFWTVF